MVVAAVRFLLRPYRHRFTRVTKPGMVLPGIGLVCGVQELVGRVGSAGGWTVCGARPGAMLLLVRSSTRAGTGPSRGGRWTRPAPGIVQVAVPRCSENRGRDLDTRRNLLSMSISPRIIGDVLRGRAP